MFVPAGYRFFLKMPPEKVHHPVRGNFPDARRRPGHHRPGDREVPPLHVEFDGSFFPAFKYEPGTPDDMHPVTGRAPFRVGTKEQCFFDHLIGCMIEIDPEYSLSQHKADPFEAPGFLRIFCLFERSPCRGDIDKRVTLFSRCRDIRRFGQLPVALFGTARRPSGRAGSALQEYSRTGRSWPVTPLTGMNDGDKLHGTPASSSRTSRSSRSYHSA